MDEKIHPGLRDLRNKVKEVMIPLLVEVFESKLAAQQAQTLPSRLQSGSPRSCEEIRQELEALLKDVKLLTLWGQSCENQILKAIEETKEKPKASFRYTLPKEVSSTGEKTFAEVEPSKISVKGLLKRLAFRKADHE